MGSPGEIRTVHVSIWEDSIALGGGVAMGDAPVDAQAMANSTIMSRALIIQCQSVVGLGIVQEWVPCAGHRCGCCDHSIIVTLHSRE